jgi:hypothetical protein
MKDILEILEISSLYFKFRLIENLYKLEIENEASRRINLEPRFLALVESFFYL